METLNKQQIELISKVLVDKVKETFNGLQDSFKKSEFFKTTVNELKETEKFKLLKEKTLKEISTAQSIHKFLQGLPTYKDSDLQKRIYYIEREVNEEFQKELMDRFEETVNNEAAKIVGLELRDFFKCSSIDKLEKSLIKEANAKLSLEIESELDDIIDRIISSLEIETRFEIARLETAMLNTNKE
jgi:hypothetical protein